MALLRRLIATLRHWGEREDAAPQVPPVPGRTNDASERDPGSTTLSQAHPHGGGLTG